MYETKTTYKFAIRLTIIQLTNMTSIENTFTSKTEYIRLCTARITLDIRYHLNLAEPVNQTQIQKTEIVTPIFFYFSFDRFGFFVYWFLGIFFSVFTKNI